MLACHAKRPLTLALSPKGRGNAVCEDFDPIGANLVFAQRWIGYKKAITRIAPTMSELRGVPT